MTTHHQVAVHEVLRSMSAAAARTPDSVAIREQEKWFISTDRRRMPRSCGAAGGVRNALRAPTSTGRNVTV